MTVSLAQELDRLGVAAVSGRDVRPYLSDATEARGLQGRADAVALPGSADEVAQVLAWCYERGIAVTPRGGGSGYAGGAVPDGGVVVSLSKLRRVRAMAPEHWHGEVEAGVATAHVQRLARENGLSYPPDPGAAEQSQIGGNAATNAGGPHAFKYGVTGAWVTGLEVAVAPGELVRVGGRVRKDVAGYDLRALMVGSEGTLGIITAVTLRFIPRVPARELLVGIYADVAAGCRAVQAAMSSGVVASALEFLDAYALAIAAPTYPGELPEPSRRGFMVIAEADGEPEQAAAAARELAQALRSEPGTVVAVADAAAVEGVWRWRDGLGLLADAHRGGKVSEDVGVPGTELASIVDATAQIARRHGLEPACWGHAGDGNVHSTFMFDRHDTDAVARARAAAQDLFAHALALGGTVSGKHGVGLVKNGQLRHQWPPAAVELHRAVKAALDPRNLLNPGKKLP